MPRKIDTAFIEYVPDFSSFERVTGTTLDRIFADVERTAEDSAQTVEDSFADMGRQVDDVFQEIGRTSETEFGQVGRAAGEAATQVGADFERGAEQAESSFDELRRSASRDFDRIERDARSTSTATGKHFNVAALGAGAAVLGIGAAAAAGLGALTTMGLMSAASLEQTKVSFDSLLGSAEEGGRVFKQLQAFAAATPFEFPEIADAAKRFLAFNESVGLTDAQLQQYLTTVGNVISVTGGGAEAFGRINLAIGQIGSASKITLDNLNQIADAIPGFSPIAAIAKGLGVSTAEAMDMVSAGAVPAAQGVQFLLKGMQQFPGAAGAMEKQSQTLLGVFSTFKDVVGQTLAEAFAPAIPAIKSTLTEITPIIGQALGTIAPALGGLLTSILPLIGDLVGGLAPVLKPILDGLGAAFKAIGPVLKPLGDALGAVIHGLDPLWPVIGKVVDALGTALTPVVAALAPILLDLAQPIADIVLALVPLIPPLAELIRIVLLLVEPLLKAVSAFISWVAIEGLVPIVNLLVKGLNLILIPIAELAEALELIDWGAVGDAIGGAFSDAWDAVVRFFVGIGKWFSDLPGKISDFLSSLPERIMQVFGLMFDAAFQMIGIGIGLIIVAFTRFPKIIMNTLFALPQMISEFFSNLWTGAKDTSVSLIDQIVDFVMNLPGRIINALITFGPILAKLFIDAFNNANKFIMKFVDDTVKFVMSIPGRIGDFAMQIGTSIANFFKSFLNRAIDAVNSGIARVDALIPGDLPRIPRLAHGGIAMGPALIGEDSRTTPEAAIPLGDARAMAMLREGLGMGGTVTFQPGSITVNIAGTATPEQAKKIGEGVGTGIANVLSQNGIRTAVRTI